MNNINLKIFCIGIAVVIFAAFVPVFAHASNLAVTEMDVADIRDGSATIEWKTAGAKTSGIIYLGEKSDVFNRSMKYGSYSYDHHITIGGFEGGKTYFYKILVADNWGNWEETFVRSFSTKDMKDTKKPVISNLEVAYNKYEAIVLKWSTDEKTSATVKYGTSSGNLNKKISAAGMDTEHEIVLTKIEGGKTYYITVIAQDAGKNISSKSITTSVSGGSKENAKLKISDIAPVSSGSSSVSASSVKISFMTNLPAKSKIQYGTDSKTATKKVDVSDEFSLKHSAQINGLKPNTTYFYKIEIYDSLYHEKLNTSMLSFSTDDVSVRYASGSLVRAKGDVKVYWIYRDTKAWIENPAVFLGLGLRGEWVQDVDAYTLKDYVEADSIKNTKRHPSGSLVKYADKPAVYLIEGAAKRPIANVDTFNRNGFKWDRVITISKSESYASGDYIG